MIYDPEFDLWWDGYIKTQSANAQDFKAVAYACWLAGYKAAETLYRAIQ